MKNLEKSARALFADESGREGFIRAITDRASAVPAILWVHEKMDAPFKVLPPASWQPEFVDRIAAGEKPGRHPLHAEGRIYCLDLGSVFMAVPFMNLEGGIRSVIDVCSAPGGKALCAWRALHPELLAANETIGKRTAALVSNFERCSVDRVVVTSLDSQILAEAFPDSADLVIVDAPCSGQALVAKGSNADNCFHPVTLNRNAMRQRRIISNAAKMVAPGGCLAYMTCSFSREENEGVIEWFLSRQKGFESVNVPVLDKHISRLSDVPCYRLWPQDGMGSGGFTSLLKRENDGEVRPLEIRKVRILWRGKRGQS